MPSNSNLISDDVIREIMNNRKIKIRKSKDYVTTQEEGLKYKEQLNSEIPKKI